MLIGDFSRRSKVSEISKFLRCTLLLEYVIFTLFFCTFNVKHPIVPFVTLPGEVKCLKSLTHFMMQVWICQSSRPCNGEAMSKLYLIQNYQQGKISEDFMVLKHFQHDW